MKGRREKRGAEKIHLAGMEERDGERGWKHHENFMPSFSLASEGKKKKKNFPRER